MACPNRVPHDRPPAPRRPSRARSSSRPGGRAPRAPSITSQPAARAAATSAVSPSPRRVGELDHRLPRDRLRRAARRARASRSRSGRSPRRRAASRRGARRRACRRAARARASSIAPPAPITHARFASIPARISRSVLKPSTRPSRKTSVFTASPSASSHAATTACLCGIVTFAPAKPSVRSARDRLDRVLDVERRVVPVEPGRREGGVLHQRRERVRDRMAEQRDVPRHQP